MKKYVLLAAAVVAVIFIFSGALAADGNDDLQAIKKAVKENPNYEAGREVQWFKVLVTDNKTNKDTVKITVPLCLVEVFLSCAEDTKIKAHEGDAEVDLRAAFKELKAKGPLALIEIKEDDTTVKIWLE